MEASLTRSARNAQDIGGRRTARQAHAERQDVTMAAQADLSIGTRSIPSRVQPNQNVDLGFEVTNNMGNFSGQLHPDSCAVPGLNFQAGINTNLVVEIGGETVAEIGSKCIGPDGGSKTFTATWTTPNVSESKTIEVVVRAVGGNSGDTFDTFTTTIDVAPSAPSAPSPDQSGGGLNLPVIGTVDTLTTLLLGGFGTLLVPVFLAVAI